MSFIKYLPKLNVHLKSMSPLLQLHQTSMDDCKLFLITSLSLDNNFYYLRLLGFFSIKYFYIIFIK